jgi:hypothetical protein
LVKEREFSHFQNIQTDSVAHPATCSVGTGVPSLGVKEQRHGANLSLPSCSEIKEWSCACTLCLGGVEGETVVPFLYFLLDIVPTPGLSNPFGLLP